jgi:hypothetical protein
VSNIAITLTEQRMRQLEKLAQEVKVSPEELLRARVEHWLNKSPSDFSCSAQYVLKKNEELYRRLA